MSEPLLRGTGPEIEPDPRRWIALAVLLIAGFMNLMDVTIVNVALASLQSGLGASSSQIEWIVAGFVLAFALGLLPFGRMGDIFGRRDMFVIGVFLFSLTSAICGIAPNIELLIASRVAQGLAGAMMMPQVLAIVQNIFPPQERGTAFGMFGLSAGLAAVAGPVIGGSIISADLFGLGWRPIFLVNVPIGIAAVIASLRLIPRLPGNDEITNDWVGIGLASASVFGLVFPLIEGRTYGWPAWAFAMIGLSFAGFAGFIAWERRRERRQESQLLPMALLANRNYLVGLFATLAFFSGLPGFFMILALFLQIGFGFTPFQSGLTTIPFPAGIFLVSFISSRLGGRYLKTRLILGTLVLMFGMFLVRETIATIGDSVERMVFLVPLFVAGIGMGFAIGAMFQTILSGVPLRDAGSGSGGLQAFQQVGGALGVAIIGEIFFTGLTAGGAPTHLSFVTSATNSMYYELGIFGVVVVLAMFLAPSSIAPGRVMAPPVPVEG